MRGCPRINFRGVAAGAEADADRGVIITQVVVYSIPNLTFSALQLSDVTHIQILFRRMADGNTTKVWSLVLRTRFIPLPRFFR